jgi:hypothetical protein
MPTGARKQQQAKNQYFKSVFHGFAGFCGVI